MVSDLPLQFSRPFFNLLLLFQDFVLLPFQKPMLDFIQILSILLVIIPLYYFVRLTENKNIFTSPNLYLALFMLVTSVNFFMLLGRELNYPLLSIISFYLIQPGLFLSTPLLYLYCRKLTSTNFKLFPEIIFHLIPPLIILGLSFFFFGRIDFETKLLFVTKSKGNYLTNDYFISFMNYFLVIQKISSFKDLIYAVFMIIPLLRHNRKIENYYSNKSTFISLNWLKIFVITIVFITLLDLYFHKFFNREMQAILLLLFYGFLGFFGKRQTLIYTQNFIPLYIGKLHDSETREVINDEKQGVSMSPELLQSNVERIEELMKNEKIFTDNTLCLYQMAHKLKMPRNILSSIINNHYSKNFYQFINEYRIEEAKKMLLNPKYNHLSIEGIAQTVGFNSKSVFNPIFKKITGVTPSEFRKNKQN